MIAGLFVLSGQPTEDACRTMLGALTPTCATADTVRALPGCTLGSTGTSALSSFTDRSILVGALRLDHRRDLERALGGDYRGLDDLALVHRALHRWGEAALPRIEGDFALAFYIPSERRLLLARDPLGQRPLFWAEVAGGIAFASMPRGLHAAGVARAPDFASVAGFLQGGIHPPGHSFFARVHRVMPGTLLECSPSGQRSATYWTPAPAPAEVRDLGEAVEAYRALLGAAVASRLPGADRPLATHLSGGLDSGAVTATAALLRLAPLDAFTAVPSPEAARAAGGRLSDESALAAATAARFAAIRHHRIGANPALSPLDALGPGLALHERPLFNLCNHGWLGQIRAAARARGARVLLTGEIGNWTISAGPMTALPALLAERGLGDWLAASRTLRRASGARWRGILARTFLPAGLVDARLAGLPPLLRPGHGQSPGGSLTGDWRDEARAAFAQMDFGEYRAGVTAQSGIEERDPTADPRLVAFALSLPTALVLGASGRRPLARAALADRLPPEVLNARRKGYQGADWFLALAADRERVAALVAAIAASPTAGAVIDTARLARLWDNWPTRGWDEIAVIAAYRNRFLQALTAGHFLMGAAGEPLPFS